MSMTKSGPISVLKALSAASSCVADILEACQDAVEHIEAARAKAKAGSKGASVDPEWIKAVARTISSQLSGAAVPAELLQQYGHLLSRCLQHQEAVSNVDPDSCSATFVTYYRCVRLLVTQKAVPDALSHGTQLVQHAQAAAVGGWDLPAAMQEAAIGSGLTVLICAYEQPSAPGAAPEQLLAAARTVAQLLRLQPPAKTQQHADALFKYILKVLAILKPAPCDAGAVVGLVSCLVQAVLASPSAAKLPQVAVKAVSQLPQPLSWCALAGCLSVVAAVASDSNSGSRPSGGSPQQQPAAEVQVGGILESMDALLDWAQQQQLGVSWADCLAAVTQNDGVSSSSSWLEGATMQLAAACLRLLLQASDAGVVLTQQAELELQQHIEVLSQANSSSSGGHDTSACQQQQQPPVKQAKAQKSCRSVRSKESTKTAVPVLELPGPQLQRLLQWCCCKLAAPLQQRLCFSSLPAGDNSAAVGRLVLQLLLLLLHWSSEQASQQVLQVHAELLSAAGPLWGSLCRAGMQCRSSGSSRSSSTSSVPREQEQLEPAAERLVEVCAALYDTACAQEPTYSSGSRERGSSFTAAGHHLQQARKQLYAAGCSLSSAGHRHQAVRLLLPACYCQLAAAHMSPAADVDGGDPQEGAQQAGAREACWLETLKTAKALFTAAAEAGSLNAAAGSSAGVERHLIAVLVHSVAVLAAAPTLLLQQLPVLLKGWCRYMRHHPDATAASQVLLEWLLGQQQLESSTGLWDQQQAKRLAPLLVCIMAADLAALRQQAAAGKLPADRVAAASSCVLELAVTVLPAGHNQQLWQAECQLLQVLYQPDGLNTEMLQQLGAVCTTLEGVLGNAAEQVATKGGKVPAAKSRRKQQPVQPDRQKQQLEDPATSAAACSAAGLAYCLQGLALLQQQQQQPAATPTSAATPAAANSSATEVTAEEQDIAGFSIGAQQQQQQVAALLCKACCFWQQCQQQQLLAQPGWCLPQECAAAAAQAQQAAGSQGWWQLERCMVQVQAHLLHHGLVPAELGKQQQQQEHQQQQQQGQGDGSASRDTWLVTVLAGPSCSRAAAAVAGQQGASAGGRKQRSADVEEDPLVAAISKLSLQEAGQQAVLDSSRHGAADGLQVVQQLLDAAYAAWGQGDTLAAVQHAEAAAKRCSQHAGAARARPGAELAPSSRVKAAEQWRGLQLYCSCCWLMGQLLEVLGLPEESVSWFKELHQLAGYLGSAALGAAAAGAVAWLQARRGEAAKAAAALQLAEQLWPLWLGELDTVQDGMETLATAAGTGEQGAPGQLLQAYLHSWLGSAKAELCLIRQEQPQAGEHLVQAHTQLSAALRTALHASSGEQHLLAAAGRQLGSLSRCLAHCQRLQGATPDAQQVLQEGLELLRQVAELLQRPISQLFSHQQASLRLEHLCCSSAKRSSCSPRQSQLPLQLAGFSCSSSHDLRREFAGLLQEQKQQEPAAGAAGAGGRRTGSKRGQEGKQHGTCTPGIGPESEQVVELSTLQFLQQLLELLRPCRAAPLLLQQACRMLSGLCRLHGALPAAAMFLQLSLGSSIQQQHLVQTQRMARKAAKAGAAATPSHGSSSTPAADGAADQHTAGSIWQRAGELLSVEQLLDDVAICCGAAVSPASGSSSNSGSGSSSGSSRPPKASSSRSRSTKGTAPAAPAAGSSDQQQLLQQLDAVAQLWLDGLLQELPVGCALNSISSCDEPTEGALLLCRCSAGARPLLVTLQRVEGEPHDGQTVRPVGEITQRLADTLSASSASMAGTASLNSSDGKVAWWQQRLALNASMQELLQGVSRGWLGPWRCLLMQPAAGGGPGVVEACSTAAAELVEEHFGAVLDGASAKCLSQLVAQLLLHLDQLSSAEVATAALHISQLTQHRADGGQLQQLVSALQDTHATLSPQLLPAASAAAVDCTQVGLKGSSRVLSTPRHPLQEVNTGLISSSSNSNICSGASPSAAGQAAAEGACPPTTPAPAKAASRLGAPPTVQRGTAGRSRLQAMQQSTPAKPAAGAGAAEAEDLCAALKKGLRLRDDPQPEQQQQQQPASAMAAPGRRVRFTQEPAAAVQPESSMECAVPPSVLRHGTRRSKGVSDAGHAAGTSLQLPGLAEEGGPNFMTPAPKPKQGSRLGGMSTSKPVSSRSRLPLLVDAARECTADSISSSACSPDAVPAAAGRTACSSSSSRGSRGVSSSSGRSSQVSTGCSAVLVLDSQLQALPWEALPGLQQQQLYRCPNLAVAAALAHRAKHLSSSSAHKGGEPGSQPVLQAGAAYFLLNPDGDLPDTQQTFQPWLQDQLHLQGLSGQRPAAASLAAALQDHDLFLYFGHGSGEQYLPQAGLRRLPSCAGGVLLGCSSGRLRSNGMYEPSGPVLGYLLAGCPAAISNLWDVTDRDIDRFGELLLQHWLGSNGAAQQGSSNSRGSASGRATNPARASQGSSSSSRSSGGSSAGCSSVPEGGAGVQCEVVAAINSSRSACRLPWLIGAAPVCYGVPTQIHPLSC